jgi:hypothetical protein
VAVVALFALLLGSLTGLVAGRWEAAMPFAVAIVPATLLAGPAAGALGLLGLAGFVAGRHLHHVVADEYQAGPA